MNHLQSFFYNEYFYRKLALTLAVIRSTPVHLTPRDYAKQCQQFARQHQYRQRKQIEQIRTDIRSYRCRYTLDIPKQSIDLLTYHDDFLGRLSLVADECNIEMQSILIDTIKRVFNIMEENLHRINDEHYYTTYRRIIHRIFMFDHIPTVREHSIEYLGRFIDRLLNVVQQSSATGTVHQMLVEYIGRVMEFSLLSD
jgi:hypothetical protein